MSLISADEVSQQVQHGQIATNWAVFQPPPFPRLVLIFYGILFVAFCPLVCTAMSGLVFWLWIQPDLVQSSFWPMYTTYPLLAICVIALPFFLIWLGWWLEKRDRDTLVVLMPQGFVEYKPWSNEWKRRARVIEYANVAEIVCQKKLAGIVVIISGNNGHQETIFLTRKYSGTLAGEMVHQNIAQRIVNDQRRLHAHFVTEENGLVEDQQPSNDGWLKEGKVSRRVLLRIAEGLAIAAPLASGGIAVAEFIHWDSRTLFTDKGHSNKVSFVAWSPDGKHISSAGWDRIAHIWDGNTENVSLVTYRQHSNGVNSAAWSPDGKLIVSDGDNGIQHIWEAFTGKIHVTYTAQQADGNEVFSSAWSPDGNTIASGDFRGIIQIWNALTGKTLLNYTAHSDCINTVAWSPDGSRVASASCDGSAKIWDASSGNLLLVYTEPGQASINQLAWSPDNTLLALACSSKQVIVWKVTTGKVVQIYTGHTESVLTVAWSPDGKSLASGSADSTAQIWDASTGKQRFSPYRGHRDDVSSIAWSPDGTRMVTGSMDTTVQVWKVTDGLSLGL